MVDVLADALFTSDKNFAGEMHVQLMFDDAAGWRAWAEQMAKNAAREGLAK